MYSYTYDQVSGGIILNSTPTNFSKEPRPVYAPELDLLGFEQYWSYDKQDDIPYMWAESNVYWYRGIQIAKTKGGDLYNAPELIPIRAEDGSIPFSKLDGDVLQQIDIVDMCAKNAELLTILEDTTVKKIVKEYEKFKKKLDIFHVAFSGGKDSAVLLDLVKKALPVGSYVVIFGDTGMEFPDTYTFPQQTNLNNKEKIVLKTILIMQAVDQRLGGSIPVLKPTDQNLSYAFEGDWDELENECKSIAKSLVNKGVLILTPISDGKKVYSAAVLAGDGAKIDKYKDEVRKAGTIIDVKKLDVDLLSASAHKFNGPKGIGFLYIKRGTNLLPFNDGGAQEYGMRAGTENIAAIVAMAVALKQNVELMERHQKRLLNLEKELLNGLQETGLNFIRNGSESHVPGNVSLSFQGADQEAGVADVRL